MPLTTVQDDRNKWRPPTREAAYAPDDVDNLYSGVDPAIESMISGEGFDATEMAMQSAQGRMERTRRASAARGMGAMATQGMGSQMAQAFEGDLAGTRMQSIFDIGQGRQEMKERGIQSSMYRIGQAEDIRTGREEIRLAGERLDLSRLDSKRRYELGQNAQRIQEAYQNGQLTIQQAQLELQRLIQKTNADLGNRRMDLSKRQLDIAQAPIDIYKQKQIDWEEQIHGITLGS